jgi:hypothetical protein
MTRANCLLCGKREAEHHSFEAELAGLCECHPPQPAIICRDFVASRSGEFCDRCYHERECHKPEGA